MKKLQSCTRIVSIVAIYLTVSLAPEHAKASLWQMQCNEIIYFLSRFSRVATPFFTPIITLQPSDATLLRLSKGSPHSSRLSVTSLVIVSAFAETVAETEFF